MLLQPDPDNGAAGRAVSCLLVLQVDNHGGLRGLAGQ